MTYQPKLSKPKRIALVGLPLLQMESPPYCRQLLKYANEQNRSAFICNLEPTSESIDFIRMLDCDGVLGRIISPEMKQAALSLRVPLVNISSWLEQPGVPTVRLDNFATGRMGAEYLMQKRFRLVGTVQIAGGWFNQSRLDGFHRHIQGVEVSDFQLRSNPPSPDDLDRFRQWLRGLKPPFALMLTDHEGAQELMDACRAEGLRIPRDVAVLSCLCRDDFKSRPYNPTLTYVRTDEDKWILAAARHLDRLIAGDSRLQEIIEIPPQDVMERESTNTTPVEDPAMAKVVEFICDHIAEPINIKTISESTDFNRRTFDRRFSKALGMSAHDFLIRERCKLAVSLLQTSPRISLRKIADHCHFADVRHMKRVVKEISGMEISRRK